MQVQWCQGLEARLGTLEQAPASFEGDAYLAGLDQCRGIATGARDTFRLGVQQFPRVGALGRLEDPLDGPGFLVLAVAHDTDTVGVSTHQIQVVSDEQHAHAVLITQLGQQGEYLLLDGYIQGGGGFVGHQQLRLVGDGHGDHDPLTLSAGQLVRPGIQQFLGTRQFYLLQQFAAAMASRTTSQALMQAQGLRQLSSNGVQRIERSHRLLKHETDAVTEKPLPFARREPRQIGVAEPSTACDRGVGRQQVERAERGDRLARPRLAHQRQGLATPDVQRQFVDHGGVIEADRKPIQRQQDVIVHARGFLAVSCYHWRFGRGADRRRRGSPRR